MRISAPFPVIALAAACSADATPVDMEYLVTVETTEDTCGRDPAPEGFRVVLDARLGPDGRVTLEYPSGYAPGRGAYDGVGVHDGEVKHSASGVSAYGQGDDVHRISGTLTMEKADLVIEERRATGGGPRSCVRKARLRGDARPLWTAELDGKYEADYAFYGLVCPPDAPSVPMSMWTVPLDIQDYGDSALFAFDSRDENLTFEMPAEDFAFGNVSWYGPIYIIVPPFGWYELEGGVAGFFLGGRYDLRISFHEIGDVSGCAYILDAGGAKRPPDPARANNVYRLAYAKSDACQPDGEGNPMTETFEQEGEIVFMADGRMTLMHGYQRVDLEPLSDGRFAGHWEQGGATLDYAAAVDPPDLTFSYVYELPWSDGTCRIAFEAIGVPRYFDDLELFPPDLPTADPQARMLLASPPVVRPGGLAETLSPCQRLRPFSEAPPTVLKAIGPRMIAD